MPYSLSKKAEQDLISIYIDGFEQFGEAQAEKYHAELEKVFDMLGNAPEVNRERGEFTPPVRIHPYKAHLLIYTGNSLEGAYIVRVIHKREDWSNRSTLF